MSTIEDDKERDGLPSFTHQGDTGTLGLTREQGAALEVVRAGTRKVVGLFLERADELAFPGVDAEEFRRALAGLSESSAQLAAAKAALSVQLVEQARRVENLDSLARRGLAYARIYADGDEELEQVVAAVDVGRKPAPTRRSRGRKPKAVATPSAAKELPFHAAEVA